MSESLMAKSTQSVISRSRIGTQTYVGSRVFPLGNVVCLAWVGWSHSWAEVSRSRAASMDEWMEKTWGIYINNSALKQKAILLFAATWMILKNIILGGINQTQKDEYCMMSVICGIWKCWTHRSREKEVAARGWGQGDAGHRVQRFSYSGWMDSGSWGPAGWL